ncbi:hypothetical protein GH714_034373 [Hevea brasiliensis]|uniref:Transposase-associated domain-containing protein n=1 Tax=Hevea brasiliensis TaxID=3981 RepID=A0A6A6KK45_HEVBR|nr:hypothetical protein GH714_034373 [Hevea brasiliensis]
MAPSKGWMDLVGDRLNNIYLRGVEEFLDYAFKKTGTHGEIRCPCVKCSNTYSATREVVGTHLKVYGIIHNYTFWYHHGERVGESESDSESVQLSENEPSNEMHNMLMDLYPEFCDQDANDMDTDTFIHDIHEEEPNDEANKFYRLLRDFEQPLYQEASNVIWVIDDIFLLIKWRNDKKSFDGTRERGLPPKALSGDDILNQVKDLEGTILTKAPHVKKAI